MNRRRRRPNLPPNLKERVRPSRSLCGDLTSPPAEVIAVDEALAVHAAREHNQANREAEAIRHGTHTHKWKTLRPTPEGGVVQACRNGGKCAGVYRILDEYGQVARSNV